MRLEFTELQFTIAIIKELTEVEYFNNSFGTVSFYTPSLSDEANLGYDTRIDRFTPLFLQFKRPKYMIGVNSKYNVFGSFNVPYFQFDLYTNVSTRSVSRDSQHNLLVGLARSGQSVYYCAPLFHDISSFDRFYISGEISENSIYINANNLRKYPTNEDHELVYDSNSLYQVFSINKNDKSKANNLMQIIEKLNKKESFTINEIVNIIRKEFNFSDDKVSTINELQNMLVKNNIIMTLLPKKHL